VDVAIRDDLGARVHGADHDQVGALRPDALARADRLVHDQRRAAQALSGLGLPGGGGRFGRRLGGGGRGRGQRLLRLPPGGAPQRGKPRALRRRAHLRRAAGGADGHDLDLAEPGCQGREVHLARRHLQVVQADHHRREAQEARGSPELVAEDGDDGLRPVVKQPQHQEVEIRAAQAEGLETGLAWRGGHRGTGYS
jgi:hypothetical protein